MQYGSLSLTLERAVPPVVRASGELDAESFGCFETTVRDALGKCEDIVCLDLGELTYVDSSGVSALAKAAMDASKSSRRLKIISMTPHLDHLLALAGIKDLFIVSIAEHEARDEEPPTGKAKTRTFGAPREANACRSVREQVCEFARQMGFGGMALEDIRLAIGEAVSNAVRHGAVCGESMELHCLNSANRLTVTIKYPSAEFDPSAVPTPTYSTASEGGMGIHFMKLVMDKVHYEFLEGRTELTLEKKLAV